MEAEARRTTNEDNSEKVSGTLDAIALYIAQQYGLTKSEAAKAAALMWLEHECDLAEKSDERKINGNLKSLSDFEEEEGQPAQGMVFQSRVFLNVSKLSAEALKEIPSLLVEELLSSDGPAVKIVRMICKCALSAKSALKYVPEGNVSIAIRTFLFLQKMCFPNGSLKRINRIHLSVRSLRVTERRRLGMLRLTVRCINLGTIAT